MAIPIVNIWKNYFSDPDEGLGSSYERVIINHFLNKIVRNFKVESVLEAPCFGFTGLSGINSMNLALKGMNITLLDHDEERISLMEEEWKKTNLSANFQYNTNYDNINLPDKSIDFSWNFSALWFVQDITQFLAELNRVTKKVIVLCVPNTTGLGYLSQKYFGKKELQSTLKEEYISPGCFKPIMKSMGWNLILSNFIDCPPWPDIGMPKEEFVAKFGIKLPPSDEPKSAVTIMDFYRDKDPLFEDKMLQYFWLEKAAPDFFKQFWAHHKYYVFVPN